jgi:hypothetical protein
MTAKARILRTLRGEKVDRVAIYTQIPFAVGPQGFRPGAFHGYADYDNWREQDPAYCRLVRRMEVECDNFFVWRPPCMESDQFFIPASRIKQSPDQEQGEMIIKTQTLQVGAHTLQTVRGCRPGTGHTWVLEHVCKRPDDARLLLDLPWEGHPAGLGDFSRLETCLGERGVIWVTVPSPILVVCRLFDPTDFLMLPVTEPALIHRLLEVTAGRIRANLAALLAAGVGPIIRFGGAEHCTPPMMSPQMFDDFVVRYDAPLMQLAKEHGRLIAVHCHGRIRHALQRFLEMGVDQTDPVEQPPDGEVTLTEARAISEGRITLTGNIQVRELASLSPDAIRVRVRAVIEEAGPTRLIVTSTGTPLEAISPAIEANYHAMIDETLAWKN